MKRELVGNFEVKGNLGKIVFHLLMIAFLVSIGFAYWDFTHQDCDENPPQHCYYTSNNIRDEGYQDCKTTQFEEDNIFFPDKPEIMNCLYDGNRIQVEFKETKYECATSNATAHYRNCKK